MAPLSGHEQKMFENQSTFKCQILKCWKQRLHETPFFLFNPSPFVASSLWKCSSNTNNLPWPLSLNHLAYSNLFLQLLPLFHPFTLSLTSLALFIPSPCLSLPVHFLLPVRVHALPVPLPEGPPDTQTLKQLTLWPCWPTHKTYRPVGANIHTDPKCAANPVTAQSTPLPVSLSL